MVSGPVTTDFMYMPVFRLIKIQSSWSIPETTSNKLDQTHREENVTESEDLDIIRQLDNRITVWRPLQDG